MDALAFTVVGLAADEETAEEETAADEETAAVRFFAEAVTVGESSRLRFAVEDGSSSSSGTPDPCTSVDKSMNKLGRTVDRGSKENDEGAAPGKVVDPGSGLRSKAASASCCSKVFTVRLGD